jgi:hypothetical protein
MNNQEIMEQKIKNFDRHIEKMMNESSVAPPFGAWNRIAAELDAMPIVAGEAAEVVATTAPSSSWRFFAIAGVVVLTGLTTVGMFYKSGNVETKAAVAATATPTANVLNVENKVEVVELKQITSTSETTRKKANAAKFTQNEVASIDPLQVKETEVVNVSPIVASLDENGSHATETDSEVYSLVFPAIDRDETKIQFSSNSIKDQDDEDDNRAKVKSGSSYKMKFKKPKRQRFSYGHLNRVK